MSHATGPAPGLAEVLAALRERAGVDLRGYGKDVLERRLHEHLDARGLALPALLAALDVDDEARQGLLRALRVGTTSFFRDRPVFDALRDVVLPSLAPPRAVRAWVAGCSTGEEAWSLAAVLSAVVGEARVVASDVDAGRVAVAERGVYVGDHDVGGYGDCFVAGDGVVSPAAHVRACVDFAVHDVLGEAVAPAVALVASFDVVFFRNVLIYLTREARDRALARLARVVVAGGALVVGSAESLDDAPAFAPWPGLPAGLRIYRRAA